MRILLVEDDRKAAQILANGLEEDGFVVDVAGSGEEGDDLARVNDYDLILLDWLLPSGIEVCRRLRRRRLETRILMLTARDAVVDRVAASMPTKSRNPSPSPSSWRACAPCFAGQRAPARRSSKWPTSAGRASGHPWRGSDRADPRRSTRSSNI